MRPRRAARRRRATETMSTEPVRFDPAARRAAIRRTVWIVVGLVALVYGGFFVRALLLLHGGAAR